MRVGKLVGWPEIIEGGREKIKKYIIDMCGFINQYKLYNLYN